MCALSTEYDEVRTEIPRRKTHSWPTDVDCHLYLYDGPPGIAPRHVKMITLTSPNYEWLDSMRKDPNHICVYMPVWPWEELLDANDVLELGIPDEELEERFQEFGGSARYCMSVNAVFVQSGQQGIEEALRKISGSQQLSDCFNGPADNNLITVHRLMHYMPNMTNHFATLFPASQKISERLHDRICKIASQERDQLMSWLHGNSKAAVLFGWLFEAIVHKKLLAGGSFVLRQLDDATGDSLELRPTDSSVAPFKSNFSSDSVIMNAYRIPESSSQPSIDSYILAEAGLWMFQITIQHTHPIKSSGLIDLLKQLELLDSVKEDPTFVKIIFVVPQDVGSNFKTQQIETEDRSFLSDLDCADVTCLTGIGQAKKRRLAEQLGIRSCRRQFREQGSGTIENVVGNP
jgi:hypothetical protein